MEAVMKSRLIQILLITLLTLLLTGCHKMQATTTIKPKGSGELKVGVGFSAEERANIEKQNGNSQDFCNTARATTNVKVTEEQRGEETWCITTTEFKTLDELRHLYGGWEGIKINRLEISDRKFYYDVDIDTLSESSNFASLTDITWTIVLPGAPISHNADQVDGSTLTWIPTPKSGMINLQAESEVSRGFSLPSCGSAFIVLFMGLLYLHQRGRNLVSQ
jgi:hypothetical protein